MKNTELVSIIIVNWNGLRWLPDCFNSLAVRKLLLMDQPDRLDAIGAFLTRTGFLYHYGFHTKNTKSLDKEIELYTVKGACMIFRRNVLRKICVEGKLFDPLYFAYFEETDICHRIWLAGYRIMYIPSSVIYHKAGGTSSAMNNTFIQYHSFKNRIQSYLTNLDFSSLLIILPTHILLTTGYTLAAFFRGKIKLGFAIIRAMVWNIWYWRVTLDKRRFVNKYIRKVSDLSLFPHIIRSPGYSYFLKLAKGLSLYQHE
ncbi:MAG: hypothetical protein NT149_02605 [Candidatus Gottesmanbacteria bacterium]|nr:hypothetical protein [Candidatus Gottesmanbacteria bacterium]